MTRADRLSLFLFGVSAALAFVPIPDLISSAAPLSSPNSLAWLGTDVLGRSVALKLWAGLRTALLYATIGAGIAVALGTFFGTVAGLFGGWVDDVISAAANATASIPKALLLTSLGFLLGRGTFTACLAIGLSTWAGVARLVRIETARLKTSEFVTSAEALGAHRPWLLWHHILPGLAPLLAAEFLTHGAYAVKAEVWLTYLGLTSSDRPSWGQMIVDSKEALLNNAWWELAAATLTMLLLLAAIEKIAYFFTKEGPEPLQGSKDEPMPRAGRLNAGLRLKDLDSA